MTVVFVFGRHISHFSFSIFVLFLLLSTVVIRLLQQSIILYFLSNFFFFWLFHTGKMGIVTFAAESSYMLSWLSDSSKYDFQFHCCDGETVWCHAVFLRNVSRFVKVFAARGEREFIVPFKSSTVRAVVNFLYTGKVDVEVNDVMDFNRLLTTLDLYKHG